MKGVQCYELFGGIALKIHTFSFSFSNAEVKSSKASTDMLPLLRERNRLLTTFRRAASVL